MYSSSTCAAAEPTQSSNALTAHGRPSSITPNSSACAAAATAPLDVLTTTHSIGATRSPRRSSPRFTPASSARSRSSGTSTIPPPSPRPSSPSTPPRTPQRSSQPSRASVAPRRISSMPTRSTSASTRSGEFPFAAPPSTILARYRRLRHPAPSRTPNKAKMTAKTPPATSHNSRRSRSSTTPSARPSLRSPSTRSIRNKSGPDTFPTTSCPQCWTPPPASSPRRTRASRRTTIPTPSPTTGRMPIAWSAFIISSMAAAASPRQTCCTFRPTSTLTSISSSRNASPTHSTTPRPRRCTTTPAACTRPPICCATGTARSRRTPPQRRSPSPRAPSCGPCC